MYEYKYGSGYIWVSDKTPPPEAVNHLWLRLSSDDKLKLRLYAWFAEFNEWRPITIREDNLIELIESFRPKNTSELENDGDGSGDRYTQYRDIADYIKTITYDPTTGIWTYTRYDGSTFTIDIQMSTLFTITLDKANQRLVITWANGNVTYVDISDLFYRGGTTTTASVSISNTNLITVDVIDYVSKTYVDEQLQALRDYLDNEIARLDQEIANINTRIDELQTDIDEINETTDVEFRYQSNDSNTTYPTIYRSEREPGIMGSGNPINDPNALYASAWSLEPTYIGPTRRFRWVTRADIFTTNEGRMLGQWSIPMLHESYGDEENPVENINMDLTNEMYTVVTNTDAAVSAPFPGNPYTDINMTGGGQVITSSFTYSAINSSGISSTINGNRVTLTGISQGTTTGNITITATPLAGLEVYGTYTKTMTINRIINGQNGNFTSYVFRQSTTKPSTPTGTTNPPSGWVDYPSGDGIWWMSLAEISGTTGLAISAWSEPVQVTGEDGQDGGYVDFKYRKNTSATSAPAIVVTDRNPANWSDTPPSLNSGEYLWMTQALINANNTLGENWSAPVRISGEKGGDGSNGQDARAYYVISNVDSISKIQNGSLNSSGDNTYSYNPSSLIFNFWSQLGQNSPVMYSAYWVLAGSTTTGNFTTIQTGTGAIATVIPSNYPQYTNYRIQMYLNGTTNPLIDQETVPVIEVLDWLTEAIQNGSGIADGGLLLYNLIMVRNRENNNGSQEQLFNSIRAGMSGLSDGVYFFANDTDAYRAAMNWETSPDDVMFVVGDGGVGKWGIFQLGTNSVVVSTPAGTSPQYLTEFTNTPLPTLTSLNTSQPVSSSVANVSSPTYRAYLSNNGSTYVFDYDSRNTDYVWGSTSFTISATASVTFTFSNCTISQSGAVPTPDGGSAFLESAGITGALRETSSGSIYSVGTARVSFTAPATSGVWSVFSYSSGTVGSLPAGTYQMGYRFSSSANAPSDSNATRSVTVSMAVSGSTIIQKNVYSPTGFAVIGGSNNYIYYNTYTGRQLFDVRVGSYGLTISSAGVTKVGGWT